MNPINTGFGHLQDIRHIIKMDCSNWTDLKSIKKFALIAEKHTEVGIGRPGWALYP